MGMKCKKCGRIMSFVKNEGDRGWSRQASAEWAVYQCNHCKNKGTKGTRYKRGFDGKVEHIDFEEQDYKGR